MFCCQTALDSHSVISFFPWPLPVCFKTTITTFPQESSFYSVHIIKALKVLSPSLVFHFLASGLATCESLLLIHVLTEQIYLTGWSVLPPCVSHFHLTTSERWWSASSPVSLAGEQQEAPHFASLGSLGRWERGQQAWCQQQKQWHHVGRVGVLLSSQRGASQALVNGNKPAK